MKLLFNPTVEDRNWNLDLPQPEARNRIIEWLRQRSPQLITATDTQIVATMGSRFLTRMVGGAFSPARWVPVAMLIDMVDVTSTTTRVSVRLADNLGVTLRKGAWVKLVRRRFDQIYASIDDLWK
ncbi:MAG: hypothetical protein C1O27_000193 [Chloroflexi bacterium]|jgi:hypothetical protein|nr:MAG: hypothetical protein C1O27_000193 [Chloroflexota bacterium]